MNVFRKKFIPIKTIQKKIRNKNHHKNNSLIKKTNSQILFGFKNENELNEDINMNNTIQSKSRKYTISEDPLYLEQKNYDIESSKNIKNISKNKDINSSMNDEYNNIDEIMKNKKYNDISVKSSKINNINPKTNKSSSYLNKSSSNKSGSQNSDLSNSESFFKKKDLRTSNHHDLYKKGLIYNYNKMNNYIKYNNQKQRNKKNKNIVENISKSYNKYFDLINKGRNNIINFDNNNVETISTNDFTKLKSKYLELKNEHDLTLSRLKHEKKKNQRQKEEIDFMISNIKSEKKKNDMNDVVEEINKLKEENATFRQELVLSQALINSLQTELKNNLNNENKINFSNNNLEDKSIRNKKWNDKISKKNYNDVNELIKEINDLNSALNKKNEIIDSVLIENKKLRHELKYINEIGPGKHSNKYNKKLIDLIYNDAIDLINKYSKYRNSNIDDFNNLILTIKFFEELEKIKIKLENNKDKNNIEKMIENYIFLIKLITNEFDKLLLYNNNYWKEKYLNKYKNNNNDNKSLNNSMELNFDKEKHNLMDLCLLSSSYMKGLPKDLLLEGINLIKNLENLYKEKNKVKDSNDIEKRNINEFIISQEKQLENIKKKLSYNQYNQMNYNHNFSYSNSTSNIKNILGLTYMTNYYNNNI
jgi:hypothetical protein